MEEDFEGTRRFNRELIELLKRDRSDSDGEILVYFNIDPADTELVRTVNRQIEAYLR